MEKIKVLSSKQVILKDGKEKTFYRYFSPCMIEVIENGESKGEQLKNIEVHFKKVALKKFDDEKIFAIISGEISLPPVYEVKVNEDGSVDKPQIWVREITDIQPIPYTPKKNTCKPVLDTEDNTESVEIVG